MTNKIESIYEQISEDLVIDRTQIGNEVIKTSQLFVKYIRMFTDEDL